MSYIIRKVGREIDHDWRYAEPACHFNQAQPDGRLLVRLPKLGDMDSTARLCHICVMPGERVVCDQTLVEFDCNKLTAELPSPCEAIIEQILVSIWQTLEIGEPLLVLKPI
ncbi:MAG: biotin/lipoyl-containing protein [Candidatus Sericytochromatia bacterium]